MHAGAAGQQRIAEDAVLQVGSSEKLALEHELGNFADITDALETRLLSAVAPAGQPGLLAQAMSEAVLAGGKRFRPLVVSVSCGLFGVTRSATLQVAVAVELLHAASLALDDLPAMDNADRRRDAEALHKRFGQGQAILVATALIIRAFEILSGPETSPDAEIRNALVHRCAVAIGGQGMTGGQSIDLAGDSGVPHKTADLIAFCCEAGAILAGADPDLCLTMRAFGDGLGQTYQNRDDVLDREIAATGADGDVHAARARHVAGLLGRQAGGPANAAPPLLALVKWAGARAT